MKNKLGCASCGGAKKMQKGGAKMTKGVVKKNPIARPKVPPRGYIDSKIRMTGPGAPTSRPMMAQKGGPTPFSTRMSDAPMTPKEKRQAKRETNATMRYAKKQGSGLKMQKGGTPMTAKEKARIQKIRDYAKKKIDKKLIPTTPAPMPKSIQVPSYSKYKKAMGGEATNKLNKPRGYAKSQTGGSNIGSMIFGVPNAGMTGPNRNSVTETMKKGGTKKSFPDLNKDGKITKADILKGRGVIKKKGGLVKKNNNGN